MNLNPNEPTDTRAHLITPKPSTLTPWILLPLGVIPAIIGFFALMQGTFSNRGKPRRYASYVEESGPSLSIFTPTVLEYVAIGSAIFTILLLVSLQRRIVYRNGLQKQGRCSRCRESYSKSKPFVEGLFEVLLCQVCVREFCRGYRARQNTDALGLSDAMPDRDLSLSVLSAEVENPYSPPAVTTSRANSCSFCESRVKLHQRFGDKDIFAICDLCIAESMTLIEKEQKRREPTDQIATNS